MATLRKKVNDLLAIKEYDAEEVWINNKILDGLKFTFAANSSTAETWSINTAKTHNISAQPEKKYLCLESENSRCWIEDGFAFLGNFTGIHLDESQAFMVNMLLPKLPDAIKEIFECKTASFSPVPADAYGMTIQYGTNDIQQSAVLWMEKSRWMTVLSNKNFVPQLQPKIIPSLLFQSQVIVGRISLGYVECSQLEPGDLLFFEENYFSINGTGRIKIGNLRFDVNLERSNDQYKVKVNHWSKDMLDQEQYESEQEELISDDMAVSIDDADPSSAGRKALEVPVSDLPVKLTVKLGTIQFTVGDLAKMIEGKVYPIDSMCPGKVQLMANGMELARGQLVEVDGKLAVEVQRRWIQP